MKSSVGLFIAAAGLKLFAAPTLPLSFDLGVHPEAQGTLTDGRLEWRWTERLSSVADFSFSSTSRSEDLAGWGPGALYTVASGDGSLAIRPLVFAGRLSLFDWEVSAGLGMKTESFHERGTYQNVGTQVFDNEIGSWRIGTPVAGGLDLRLGPVSLGYDLGAWPASLYVLTQTQSSSLIIPTGRLDTVCFIGPELSQDFDITAFSWFWAGIHHEFLWLSVPRLVQNEAGDAWTTLIEGRTNQVLRILGGLRIPVPMGTLELGIGWRRTTSAASGGGAAELDQGLIFDLSLSAGSQGAMK